MRLLPAIVFGLSFAGILPRAEPVADRPNSAPSITELTLERGPCLGTCPIYRITLRSDGTGTYVGWNHAERIGVYSGSFASDTFKRLAREVEALGFSQLQESYLHPVNDLPVVRTTMMRADATRKAVRDHGAVGVPAVEGPAELLRIQAAIDQFAAQISWQMISEAPGLLRPGAL